MRAKTDKTKSYLVVTVIVLLLLVWGLVDCYSVSRKQLPSLTRAIGPLKAAAVQRTTGKNAHYHLVFSLANNSQSFSIDSDESERPLTELLRDMQHQRETQPGTAITVYYDPPAWWTNAHNIDVYQIELPYKVVYSIEEVHLRALNHAALVLLVLFITGIISLKQFLAYPASSKANA